MAINRTYEGPLDGALGAIQTRIVGCRTCPRLVEFRERKATTEKRASFRDWDYWGSPVPSHGDASARVLLLGLAPAAHGANRTGRMFTGDPTAAFLCQALHQAGFASQGTSVDRFDGLELRDLYATSVIRCSPPNDRATSQEQSSCRVYLHEEIGHLKNVRVVLALGRVAFDNFLKVMNERTGTRFRHVFAHGARYELGDKLPVLFASYHPSPRNTNTGRLTSSQLEKVLDAIRHHLAEM